MLDSSKLLDLRDRFDFLTVGMDNWKMPFSAKIPTSEFDAYNEAAIHFAGAKLVDLGESNQSGYTIVGCVGYYNAVGA